MNVEATRYLKNVRRNRNIFEKILPHNLITKIISEKLIWNNNLCKVYIINRMTEDTAKITDEILIEYKKLFVIRSSLNEANKKYRDTDYGKEQTRNTVLKSKQEISY